jgi:hypothetical protein
MSRHYHNKRKYRKSDTSPANHGTLKAEPAVSGWHVNFGLDMAAEFIRKRPDRGELADCQFLPHLACRYGTIS